MLATSISGPCIISGRLSLEADEWLRSRHGIVRHGRGSRCAVVGSGEGQAAISCVSVVIDSRWA
jgi:hypothetical protein